jgi:TolB-like protein
MHAAAVGNAADAAARTTVPFDAATPSIAVLPFVNRSREADDEYFSDGLADEMLNVLAKIRGLRVASRTSAFFFKGKDIDIPTVAQKLNVATVLEGSVRKSGQRVRITAQLVQAASDSHLWSQTYDRELDDIFAVQDDIAGSVVRAAIGAAGRAGRRGERARAEMRVARADARSMRRRMSCTCSGGSWSTA